MFENVYVVFEGLFYVTLVDRKGETSIKDTTILLFYIFLWIEEKIYMATGFECHFLLLLLPIVDSNTYLTKAQMFPAMHINALLMIQFNRHKILPDF